MGVKCHSGVNVVIVVEICFLNFTQLVETLFLNCSVTNVNVVIRTV